MGPVSRKILSLEMDLGSLITLVTIVFSMLKITRGLKDFLGNWPLLPKADSETCVILAPLLSYDGRVSACHFIQIEKCITI